MIEILCFGDSNTYGFTPDWKHRYGRDIRYPGVLQALLGDALPGVGGDRVLADMDAWGYTFRLGSARAYVERDADAAWQWLHDRDLADAGRRLRLPPSP